MNLRGCVSVRSARAPPRRGTGRGATRPRERRGGADTVLTAAGSATRISLTTAVDGGGAPAGSWRPLVLSPRSGRRPPARPDATARPATVGPRTMMMPRRSHALHAEPGAQKAPRRAFKSRGLRVDTGPRGRRQLGRWPSYMIPPQQGRIGDTPQQQPVAVVRTPQRPPCPGAAEHRHPARGRGREH